MRLVPAAVAFAFAEGIEKGTPAMVNLHNIPIARKFIYAFGLVCALCVGLGIYTAHTLTSVTQKAAEIGEHDLPAIGYLTAARADMNQVRRSDMVLALCPSPDCVERESSTRRKAIADYQSSLAAYVPLESEDRVRAATGQMTDNFSQYLQQVSEHALALERDHQASEAAKLVTSDSSVGLFHAALDASSQDVEDAMTDGKQDAAASTSALRSALAINIVITVAIVFLSALIGWQLNRQIAPRIVRGTAMLERMADGDLTVNVQVMGSDEIGRLGAAMNRSAEETRKVIQSVASSADTLAAAVAQITAQATQSASNARNQSAKTSQIAAAAEELTVTIGEISRNSESAAGSSRVSAETATQGGAVMRSAAQTMERIAVATSSVSEKMSSLALRSEEIGKVISVIQEISEQTNLLALNAAIESARAGEHGRGFAVVAGEVRRLAERTRSATEEIGGTIHSIQEETRQTLEVMRQSESAVQSGIAETTDARKNLDSIIESSKQVEQEVQLIATAATEQTSAAGEISHSAGEISQLAEQSTRGAEQAVEALNNLSSLAASLDAMVRQFRIDDNHQPGGSFVAKRQSASGFAPQTARS
jgi:methyl-accepting chemotaxis protein